MKRVVKQAVQGEVGNSETVPVCNQYKDTLDDLIDSSDLESQDQARPNDERSRNTLMSEDSSADLSERNCIDEDLLDRSSRLALKNKNSQVCQCHVVAS